MRRFILAALFALLFFPAKADFQVNQLIGFGAGGNRVATVSFASSAVSTADLTTYTFSSASLGTAASNRKIVIAVSGAVHTTATVSTMTVGGVSASLITGTKVRWPTSLYGLEIWQADVPTGSTGDVVVTWSNAQNRTGIGVWAVYGAAAAAHATATDNSAPYSQAVVVPAGGVVIGAVWGGSPVSYTWTAPMTEKYDQEVESNQLQSGASYASTAGETVTVIVAPASAGENAMAAVSFGPG